MIFFIFEECVVCKIITNINFTVLCILFNECSLVVIFIKLYFTMSRLHNVGISLKINK